MKSDIQRFVFNTEPFLGNICELIYLKNLKWNCISLTIFNEFSNTFKFEFLQSFKNWKITKWSLDFFKANMKIYMYQQHCGFFIALGTANKSVATDQPVVD